jgi:hypothetical protein
MLRVVHCKETVPNEIKIVCGKWPAENLQYDQQFFLKRSFMQPGSCTTFALGNFIRVCTLRWDIIDIEWAIISTR